MCNAPADDETVFTADDDRHRELLEQQMRARGYTRHRLGFWIAPDATLVVRSQPDESDE